MTSPKAAAMSSKFALSAIGILIIVAGLWLHRRQARLAKLLDERLPPALRAFRPVHAR
jgi:hypothetical protein